MEDLDSILIKAFEERIGVLKAVCKSAEVNKKKVLAWQEITDIVNANDGKTSRTIDQVKTRYKNIYNSTKKKLGNLKKSASKTGGGSAGAKLSTAENKVLELFSETPTFTGIAGSRESAIRGDETFVQNKGNNT